MCNAGRHQVAEVEIDAALAERMNIQVVRRSSGGGTIFTDSGTILFTIILPYNEGDDVRQVREFVAELVIQALNGMGIPAKMEGRNDIVVEGKKISGLAQHLAGNRLCSHGSLLFNANLDLLAAVLKPEAAKYKTKAVQSVRGRVTNLISYMERRLTIQDFQEVLKQKLFETGSIQEYSLTEQDLRQIEQIRREKYANPSWTYGKTPRFTLQNYFGGITLRQLLECLFERQGECV